VRWLSILQDPRETVVEPQAASVKADAVIERLLELPTVLDGWNSMSVRSTPTPTAPARSAVAVRKAAAPLPLPVKAPPPPPKEAPRRPAPGASDLAPPTPRAKPTKRLKTSERKKKSAPPPTNPRERGELRNARRRAWQKEKEKE